MHDCWDAITPIGLDRTGKQHEFVARRVPANLEPLVGVFGHHARCKRPEVLAVLDPLIEDVTHVRPARIGKQRAVAERPWPKLHAALKPCDYLAIGDHVRSMARGGFAAPGSETSRLDRSQNFAPVELGTQEWRGVAALGMTFLFCTMHDQGCADCGACIM